MSWVGWRIPKATRGQQRPGYSNRTYKRSRHLVVLVRFGRQRGMTNWVCAGVDFFLDAVGSLLCPRGRRASGCGRSGGPASRD